MAALRIGFIRKSNSLEAVGWRNEILGKAQKGGKELHFVNLNHGQRVVAAQCLSEKPVRITSVLAAKKHIHGGLYTDKNQLYFYMARYLVERISWLCRDMRPRVPEGNGQVGIVFVVGALPPAAGNANLAVPLNGTGTLDLASCDVAAAMMEEPGGPALVEESIAESLDFRRAMRKVDKEYGHDWWFKVWGPDKLEAEGIATERDHAKVREAAELLVTGDDHHLAGEALDLFPTLPADRLVPSYLYYDARADDARLCLTIARTAALFIFGSAASRPAASSSIRNAVKWIECAAPAISWSRSARASSLRPSRRVALPVV